MKQKLDTYILESVLAPVKQEFYSKFRLLIKLLIYSLKLNVCLDSI
jgi:hypothetical protein